MGLQEVLRCVFEILEARRLFHFGVLAQIGEVDWVRELDFLLKEIYYRGGSMKGPVIPTTGSVPGNYVLGFVFDCAGDRVLLIRKKRPEWQAGKLNGIGGHIEGGETSEQAMTREFQEESGYHIPPEFWKRFAVMSGPNWRCVCLCVRDDDIFNKHLYRSMTDEYVLPFSVDHLVAEEPIENLYWLLPMALYDQGRVLEIRY